MNSNKVKTIVIAALLCAVGIIIPMYSPIKITLEPASFTLGSHIAIFIAMFISPFVAISVSLGTTLGFFLGGFPIVVVMRAASHLIYAAVGSYTLQKHPKIMEDKGKTALFAFAISVIHAISEIAVVIPFYFGNNMSGAYYAKGFVVSVLLLVGVGTLIHSLIDFVISHIIYGQLKHTRILKKITNN